MEIVVNPEQENPSFLNWMTHLKKFINRKKNWPDCLILKIIIYSESKVVNNKVISSNLPFK